MFSEKNLNLVMTKESYFVILRDMVTAALERSFYGTEEQYLERLGVPNSIIQALILAWQQAEEKFPFTQYCGNAPYRREVVKTLQKIEDAATRLSDAELHAYIWSIIVFINNENFRSIEEL